MELNNKAESTPVGRSEQARIWLAVKAIENNVKYLQEEGLISLTTFDNYNEEFVNMTEVRNLRGD